MNDAELIDDVGQALWGPNWKGPMAEAVRHQKNVVNDWASGRVPVPSGVWSELKVIMRRRRHELDKLALARPEGARHGARADGRAGKDGKAMILVGQYNLPYTRRVAVSLHLLGFDFEHDTVRLHAPCCGQPSSAGLRLRARYALGLRRFRFHAHDQSAGPHSLADPGRRHDADRFGGDPGLARPAGRTGARAAAAKWTGAPAGAAAHCAGERHDRQGHGHRLRAPDPPGALSLAGLDRALPHPGRGRPRRAGEAVMAG